MPRAVLALVLLLAALPVAGQNLGEIATDNDDYSVATEPTDDKLLLDFNLIPSYRQYDIDRPPSSCNTCDEFTGSESLTWRWGNQGSSTVAVDLDAAHLTPQIVAGTNIRVRWTTGPDGSSTDWVATAKYSNLIPALDQSNGLILLVDGDETTPTSMYACSHEFHGGGAILGYRNITVTRLNSYTSFHSEPTGFARISRSWGANYLRMRYDTSAKGFYCGYSGDGIAWIETTVQTLADHPTTSMGYFAQSAASGTYAGDAWVWWFRVRTDSAGITYPYPAGQE